MRTISDLRFPADKSHIQVIRCIYVHLIYRTLVPILNIAVAHSQT